MRKIMIAGAVLALILAVIHAWEGNWIRTLWSLSFAAFLMIYQRESRIPKLVSMTIFATMLALSVWVLVQAYARTTGK